MTPTMQALGMGIVTHAIMYERPDNLVFWRAGVPVGRYRLLERCEPIGVVSPLELDYLLTLCNAK